MLQLGILAAVFVAAAAAGFSLAGQIRQAALQVSDAAPAAMPVPGAEPAADKLPAAVPASSSSREAALQALSEWKGDVEVVLHRTFWCGEENRMLGRLSAAEASNLLKSRRDWGASFEPAGRLVMEENIEDLSPACRETAYIGMDADGNLSLFDGPPRKNNVIRTFFQLDVPSLESSLSKERLKELMQGIRVTDKDQYNSVLSAFSDFASRKSRGVMKSEP